MTRASLVLFLAFTVLSAPILTSGALAQDRQTLGFGRLFNNDAVGDGDDRWRTGSYTVSLLRGPDWQGTAPGAPGQVIEYRFRGETIASSNLADPAPDDRRYAGILAIGAHTHFARAGFEMRFGADLVGVGPATGVGRFQRAVHEVFGLSEPDLSNQIGNALMPTLSAEVGREIAVGAARLRPFVEAQAGAETLIRGGFDVTFGTLGQGALMLRDEVTGQRYPGVEGDGAPGLSFVVGADVAHVWDSAYLPDEGPTALREDRTRIRGGVNWKGEKSEVFYGLTWLSEEFADQPEGQVLGSIRLNLRF